MKINCLGLSLFILIGFSKTIAQEELQQAVFVNQPINFGGEKGVYNEVIRDV